MFRIPFFIFLLCSISLFAKSDTASINAEIKKIEKRIARNPDSTLICSDSLLKICKKENYSYGIVRCYILKGKSEDFGGKYKESLLSFKEGFELAKKWNDQDGMARIKQCEGNSHFYAGELQSSLGAFMESYDMYSKLKDSLGISSTVMGIANYYYQTKDYKKAIKYFQEALNIRERMGDDKQTGNILHNLAVAYEGDGNFEKAEELYLRSLKIKEQMNDEVAIAFSYAAIGKMYLSKGEPSKSVIFLQKAIEMRRTFKDIYGIANAGLGLGVAYSRLKKYPEALEILREVLTNSRKTSSIKIQMESANEMSEVFGKQGKYDSAFFYSRLFSTLNDSFMNEDKNKQMSEMQTKFETVEKEKENELLKKDNELKEVTNQRQLYVLWLVGIIGVLLLAFGIYSWNAYQQKQRANKLLETQKTEITQQKAIIEEKNKDITDSINYAQRIQKSLLPGEAFLKKHLPEHFIIFHPRDIVSGDFYWSLKHGGYLYIAVADCTGHGVPGAFMSMIGMSLLNEIIVERKIQNPGLILDIMREEVIRRLNPEGEESRSDGMDIVLLKIAPDHKKMDYAAAYNGFYLIRDGKLQDMEADKMPIGKHEGNIDAFTKRTLTLEDGDQLYLLTDGIPDQFGGPKGKKFRYSQIEQLLLNTATLPMNEQKAIFEKSFQDWKGNLEQIDDVTLMGLKIQTSS